MRFIFYLAGLLLVAYPAAKFISAQDNLADSDSSGVKEYRGLEYAHYGEHPLRLALFVPKDAEQPLPIFV